MKNQEVERTRSKILVIIKSIDNIEQLKAIYKFAIYILTK